MTAWALRWLIRGKHQVGTQPLKRASWALTQGDGSSGPAQFTSLMLWVWCIYVGRWIGSPYTPCQSHHAAFCEWRMGLEVDLLVPVLGFCYRGMGLLWMLLVSAYFACCSAILMDSVESHSTFTCEPIGLRMCQDLPYNTTFMPNLLNHYDQQTAALAMEVSGCFLSSFCFPVGLCSVWAGEGKNGVSMELVVG